MENRKIYIMYIKCLLFRAGRQIVECNHFMLRENATKSFTPQICAEAEIKTANVFCKCGLHCKCFTASTNVVFIANANVVFIESVSLQVFHYKVFHCKCFITNVSLQVFFHCKCFFIASVFHCKCFSLQVIRQLEDKPWSSSQTGNNSFQAL